MNTASITFSDLFCGAGGLSFGFRGAGFREVFAGDQWADAIDTYRQNLFPEASKIGIDRDLCLPASDLIIGGPPCQGFSSAGLRRVGDKRNSLVSVFSQIVARTTPRAFVFENVEGFLTSENGTRLVELLDPLIEVGYRIHLRKVNAANYGVPQHRKRVLAIGGLGWDPGFPTPTHFAIGAPGAETIGIGLPDTPTVGIALAGLPPPADSEPGIPQGHVVRAFTSKDLRRVSLLRPGMTMRDLPSELQHESFQRRANRRVKDGTPTERRGGPPAGLRRLIAEQPSKAITGGARSEFVHPSEDRPLTIRECARLQGFPDDFEFLGSVSSQMQQIGNAVPPSLAHAVARSLAQDLSSSPNPGKQGKLLSFVPTAANGLSPALERVNSMIFDRYGNELKLEQLPLWA